MANPIIKIKRGSGLPPVWNGSGGITAGEFAFDRDEYTLYIGLTGGGFDLTTGLVNPPETPINIPIGMQISNDGTFGGLTPIVDTSVGYSNYTVPTTYAVREYVANAVTSAAAGIEFVAGTGIAVSSAGTEPVIYTVSNTGVLKGYTAYGFAGNYTGFSRMDPSTATDFLYYNADSGIRIFAEKNGGFDQIRILNTGVTGINGITGNIKSIDPIVSLTGFTLAVGRAQIENTQYSDPIAIVSNTETGKLQIGHNTSGVVSGSYPAISGSSWNIPSIIVDTTGHITSLASTPFDFATAKPAGFTEAVQDAAYPGITGSNGIAFNYDDGGERVVASLNGILSLNSIGDMALGLCGNVRIGSGSGIAVTTDRTGATPFIKISNAAPHFRSIAVAKADSIGGGPNGGIYSGGTLGAAGAATVTAEDATGDTLNLYAGRGIGISAGNIISGIGRDDIVLWNSGINTIQFRNGPDPVGAGMSGDVIFSAGNNINLTRINDTTISITANVGGEGLGFLRADYADNVTNLTNDYEDDGLTGNIEVIGSNGLITKQTTGANTKNGSLYIALSSQLVMPKKLTDTDIDSSGYGIIKVPTAIEMTDDSTDINGGYVWDSAEEYNMLRRPSDRSVIIVDSVLGGLTGTISYGQVGDGTPYTPNTLPSSLPKAGKVLTLWAEEGAAIGDAQYIAGNQAEVRLLGWPTAEHLGAELDLSIVTEIGINDFGQPVESNPCGVDGGSCVGFPTVLPSCATGFNPDGFGTWQYTNHASGSADRPVIKMNGNVILKDSIFIDKDIWIKGNILDATTGCLFNGGNGSPGGQAVTCIECLGNGNVGITGSAYVTESIIVRGVSAHFNVDDFAIESNVIRLGSSGGQPLTEANAAYRNARGIVGFQRIPIPVTPINSAEVLDNRVSFTGVNPNGHFTFIPSAVSQTLGGAVFYTGTPGSAVFASYNGVGLTATSNNLVSIKAGPVGTLTVDTTIQGNVDIVAPSGSRSELNLSGSNSKLNLLGANSKLNVGTSSNTVTVEFLRGITFDVANAAYSGAQGNQGQNLQLTWAATNSSAQRRMYVRNLGESTASQLVDVGKYLPISSTADLATGTDSGQQVLWNKTLADGTIIDCGTY